MVFLRWTCGGLCVGMTIVMVFKWWTKSIKASIARAGVTPRNVCVLVNWCVICFFFHLLRELHAWCVMLDALLYVNN